MRLTIRSPSPLPSSALAGEGGIRWFSLRLRPLLMAQSLRFLARHPAQAGLAVLGIALGVTVVVAIDLAQASAQAAFDRATDEVLGRATHQIVGGPDGLDESLYVGLRVHHGFARAAPIIEAPVSIDGAPQAAPTLLGIDPFAERSFQRAAVPAGDRDGLRRLLTETDGVLVTPALAARLASAAGEAIVLNRGATAHRLRILGLTSAAAHSELILADIATAQELLGMGGRLSRIDLIVDDEAERQRIEGWLPDGVELLATARHGQAYREMTRAFSTQLQALSLLALLVGMFLIYQTASFLVVQRRALIGILRALGVTQAEIATVIAVEALALGLLGALAGTAAGIFLGRHLTGIVARTVSDLYYQLSVAALSVPPLLLIKGLGLGLLGTLIAALPAAREATRVAPRMAIARCEAEAGARRRSESALRWGACACAAGGALLLLPVGDVFAGFAGLFLSILGYAAMTPAALRALLRLLDPPMTRFLGTPGHLAVRGLAASLSRTAVAAAALMLAVATTIGIGLMIASFRTAVDDWLSQLLRADLYLAAGGNGQPAQPLPAGFAERIAALPEVEAVSTVRRLTIDAGSGRTQLVVYRLAPKSYAGFQLLEGDAESLWPAFENGDAVMVSEPYAWHHGLKAGATVSLRTDAGPRSFTVAAVYRDYASDQGAVAMSRRTYERHFRDRAVTGVGVYGRDGVAAPRLRSAVQAAAAPYGPIVSRSNSELRHTSLAVFDRTFTITETLRLIAGLIAFAGVLGSLTALLMERGFEHGVLRAIGVTPRGLARLILTETALMGACAGLLAIPAGWATAAALVYVINRRSFGWSMALQLDGLAIAEGLLIALLAAVLAGLYPAHLAARASPGAALRQE